MNIVITKSKNRLEVLEASYELGSFYNSAYCYQNPRYSRGERRTTTATAMRIFANICQINGWVENLTDEELRQRYHPSAQEREKKIQDLAFEALKGMIHSFKLKREADLPRIMEALKINRERKKEREAFETRERIKKKDKEREEEEWRNKNPVLARQADQERALLEESNRLGEERNRLLQEQNERLAEIDNDLCRYGPYS